MNSALPKNLRCARCLATQYSWVAPIFRDAPLRMKATTHLAKSHSSVSIHAAWFTSAGFAATLGVLIIVAFPEVVTGQRTFVFGDYGLFGYPLAYYHRQSF